MQVKKAVSKAGSKVTSLRVGAGVFMSYGSEEEPKLNPERMVSLIELIRQGAQSLCSKESNCISQSIQ